MDEDLRRTLLCELEGLHRALEELLLEDAVQRADGDDEWNWVDDAVACVREIIEHVGVASEALPSAIERCLEEIMLHLGALRHTLLFVLQ